MSNKDDQDWIDLLAGQSVANADPKTVRDAQICRGALLAHANKLKNDAEIPYPHILENVLSRLEKSNKDDQDWIDLLAGQSVANADPKTVRDAQICRGALLAHANKLKNDAEIPYPHILENVLSRLETPKPEPTVRENWFQKLRSMFTKRISNGNFINSGWSWHVGWAFAAVLVLAVSLTFVFMQPPAPESPLDKSYQAFYAQKTGEMENKWRDFQFRWEGEADNVFAFGPTAQPSPAAKAFGAGLLIGREALLGKSEIALPTLLLPPAAEESWLKTEWKPYFELGRWTVLLWTASQFRRNLPLTFWDEQREIFSQLKAAFVARSETDNDAKKVLSQLENKIEPHLAKLPTDGKRALRINLKKMMFFLAPRSPNLEYKL